MVLNKLINSHALVFNLFLENKISTLYNSNAVNNLSQKHFNINNSVATNSSKNVYLVKDVPNYISFSLKNPDQNIKLKKILQYKGYLANLIEYKDALTYINKNLSKRNKKNLKSKTSKLYSNHKISSKVYFGFIDKNEYYLVFKSFYKLLKNRFDEKKIHNRYLSKWSDLQASTYQKILDKKASLFVIYDNKKPIAITLNYHVSDMVFSHIQTYHTAYSKYNMGDICMVNHLEWLIKNNTAVFDLAIGKTYYKEKWCNHEYNFMYHVFYNKKSILSKLNANIIAIELKIIQFLRDKNIIGKLFMIDKLLYKYKNRT